MSDIIIYETKRGNGNIEVNLTNDTVWLSLKQIAALFARDKSVISRHLNNIFKSEELTKDSVVANFATTAEDGKTYQVAHYNLDVIISLGYRVKSQEGVYFRQWASHVLKEYLIKGYSLNHHQLAKRGIQELESAMQLLQKTLTQNQLVNDIGQETLQVILGYAKTWQVLLAYDEETLSLPKASHDEVESRLDYEQAAQAIKALKTELMHRGQATNLFGNERDEGLKSILGNIEQSFGGQFLYPTMVERAAHLLYFVIKDHPFTDGNKRISCLLFLQYLTQSDFPIKINDNGLIALALLVAESEPSQKDLIIRLIVNLLVD